ncbi:ribosomal protein mS29 [Acrasis kona]|uniref:Small ribosomal subunit protein mS29 n=1 Tax=Acrasis kona TaxID=1008807 RepID=A0AAW2ZI37_9EUKA
MLTRFKYFALRNIQSHTPKASLAQSVRYIKKKKRTIKREDDFDGGEDAPDMGSQSEAVASLLKMFNPSEEDVKRMNEARDFSMKKYDTNLQSNIETYPHLFSKQAPDVISPSDKNKLSLISIPDYENYFSIDGFGGNLDRTFLFLFQRALLIRQQTIELAQSLHARFNNQQDQVKGHLVTGAKGSGTSCILNTLVHHAHKNNFIVFYIPSGKYWTHGSHIIHMNSTGLYEAPICTFKWLRSFFASNKHLLKKMPTHGLLDNHSNLYELCEWGASSLENSTVAFKTVLDELYIDTSTKMVFAIDDYDALQDYSHFHLGELTHIDQTGYRLKHVHGKEYVLVEFLDRIMMQNSPNRFFVGAQSVEKSVKDAPLSIVTVPDVYDPQELNVMVEYYKSCFKDVSVKDELMNPGKLIDDLINNGRF